MSNAFSHITPSIQIKKIKSPKRAPAKPTAYDLDNARDRMALAAKPIGPERDKMDWVWRKY